MSLTVVGSIAFDAVKTPFGERQRMLGGAAVHFSLAASFFTEVRPVGPVGDDFGADQFAVLEQRGVLPDNIERVAGGQSFFWRGRYEYDLNVAHTEDTQLGVFAEFEPKLSESSRAADTLFLANIQPDLQRQVRAQCPGAGFSGLDSMNLWIETAGDSLRAAIAEVDCLVVNDAEIRQLPGESNLARAAGAAGGDRQAGRVRRGAVHRERLLRPARLPAGGGARPDRRRRQLRRRLLRLPRRRGGRPRRVAAAASDGLRHRARLLQRRGVRDRARLPAQPRGDRRALRGAAADDAVRRAAHPIAPQPLNGRRRRTERMSAA